MSNQVEQMRWRAIPEALLSQVISVLLRPSPEVAEIVTLLNHLPSVEVSEEHASHPVGFGAKWSGSNHADEEPRGNDAG